MVTKITPEQQELLISLFDDVDSKGLKYVLLRRHENFPKSIPGRKEKELDIDLLVPPDCFNEFAYLANKHGFSRRRSKTSRTTLFKRAVRSPNKAVAQVATMPMGSAKRLFFKKNPERKEKRTPYEKARTHNSLLYILRSDGMKLDLKPHLGHDSPTNGKRYRLDPDVEKYMIERREKRDTVYIPSPPDELAHLIGHIIFEYEGEISKYYRERCEYLIDEMNDNLKYDKHFKVLLDLMFFKADNYIYNLCMNKDLDDLFNKLARFDNY